MTDDDDQASEPTADDMSVCAAQAASEQRLWMRSITSFVAARSHDADPSTAVQTAADMAMIAAYDRIARILRSDEAGVSDDAE